MSKKLPYYLDFNNIDNSITDKLNRQYNNEECINKSQAKINQNIQNNLFDYTQKYQTGSEKVLEVKPIRSDKANVGLKGQKINNKNSTNNASNPNLSFWGINNSEKDSIQNMSPEYLAMKQRQELTQLGQNSHQYSGLVEDVKIKQARERMINLEKSNNNLLSGGSYQQSSSLLGAILPKQQLSQTACLNAQGEWLDYNSLHYKEKPNKYEALKKMSPEMLNNLYGKQLDQPILPFSVNNNTNTTSLQWQDSDVFDYTSLHGQKVAPDGQYNLSQRQQESYKKILSEATRLQSYSQIKDDNYFSLQ